MSRIGKRPIIVPDKTKVQINGNVVSAEGPKGKGNLTFGEGVELKLEGNTLTVTRESDEPKARSMHGLTRTIVSNLVEGVSRGFEKTLEITGVGYRAEVKGKELHLTLGYSHPVVFPLPEGVTAATPAPTRVVLGSWNKVLLGETAAKVRSLRAPEPYKGKGIRYADETIRRKQGKAGAA
ncbi:50S ribosomal protein L6 [Vulgatibacter sp.]|uniref:50S ribosomal protein L6 n=1 Tax=Vulgatibacter sp. TaxID=1971226 RepID=UPI003564F017